MRALLSAVVLVSAVAVADPYVYQPTGKRDPFADVSEKAPPKVEVCDHSLCRVSLTELKLVGIVAAGPSSVAMFEDAGGVGFMAKANAKIGLRGGRISEIGRDCVTVVEHGGNRERVCIAAAAPSVHELGSDKVIPVP